MATDWLGHLANVGRDLGRGLVQLLYPGCCLLCGRSLPPEEPHFCGPCRAGLFTDPFPSCPRCAASTGPYAVVGGRCAWCRGEDFSFERTLRLGPYADPLRQ